MPFEQSRICIAEGGWWAERDRACPRKAPGQSDEARVVDVILGMGEPRKELARFQMRIVEQLLCVENSASAYARSPQRLVERRDRLTLRALAHREFDDVTRAHTIRERRPLGPQ